jgi:hypothetical protein
MKSIRILSTITLAWSATFGLAEEAPTPSPAPAPAPVPAPEPAPAPMKLLSCQMQERKEENGGIVNGMRLGQLEVYLDPKRETNPFELRYTIDEAAGKKLDLIEKDYFPATLMAFRASELQPIEKEDKTEEEEVADMQKRQIRYFLDFLQVVGGLYSNVDVYGYHVFNDVKELGVNIVYLDRDARVLAISGQYYSNFYLCVPSAEMNAGSQAPTFETHLLPIPKIQWEGIRAKPLLKTLSRSYKKR